MKKGQILRLQMMNMCEVTLLLEQTLVITSIILQMSIHYQENECIILLKKKSFTRQKKYNPQYKNMKKNCNTLHKKNI